MWARSELVMTLNQIPAVPLPANPAQPLNRKTYHLTATNLDDDPVAPAPVVVTDIPTDVVFQRPNKEKPTFKVFDITGNLVLCYDAGKSTMSFQDPNSIPPPSPVHVRFQRSDGFGDPPDPVVVPAPPVLARRSLGVPAAPPTPETFDVWWNSIKPTSSPNVLLRDVVQTVLGDSHSQNVFAAISSLPSGFLFSSIGDYQVNTKASPSVSDSKTVSCSLDLSSPITFSDLAGLGPTNVQSLSSVVSSADTSLTLTVNFSGSTAASCQFKFIGQTSLELYLQDIGYQNGTSGLSVAQFGSSITGPGPLFEFFGGLPSTLTSLIALPTLLVDPLNTKIDYSNSPFGVDVQNAVISISTTSLTSMTIGSFSFAPVSATLTLVPSSQGVFDIALDFIVQMSLGSKKLQFSFKAISDGINPVTLDFAVSSQTAPADVLQALGFSLNSNSLAIPLDGGNSDLNVALDTIGFTLSQSASGPSASLNLSTVYFQIDASWKPWEKVLPTQVHPDPVRRIHIFTLGPY
ncbi:hypothetical protein BN14_09780 [Rhizoctonia solani AG-1 IB]|uniref:Uncharacterized protein n=1 Tax=Thanatephorus cucumeris (strain AG1-IB / isolate 7/3/14) TaxID=1108050 RepID=M5CG82_THACB|nr:hypothetical protein BN14_09780 [Rhizoctonia solani AG-1 IB]